MALEVEGSGPTNPLRDELARTQLAMHLPAELLSGTGKWIRGLIGVAEDLEKRGAKGSDIFRATGDMVNDKKNETGIFRMPDNTWGFELSDANARINQAFQNDLFPRLNPLLGGETNTEALRDVYNHPELYARLPNLGGIPVKMYQPSYGPGDSFARGKAGFDESFKPFGWIFTRGATLPRAIAEINSPALDSHLDLLTHEVQHAVQAQNNMPRGGVSRDPAVMSHGVPEYVKGGRQLNSRFSDDMQSFARQYEADGLGSYSEGLELWPQLYPYRDQMRTTGFEQGGRGGQRPGQPYQKRIDPSWGQFENYEGLVGEHQARLAAYRKFMTVPERLWVPPFLPGIHGPEAAGQHFIPDPNQMIRQGNWNFSLTGLNGDPSIQRLLREETYGP